MSEQATTEAAKKPKGLMNRFLNAVEWAGNKLPDPVIIFAILCLLVLLASAIAAWAGWQAVHPGTGEDIVAQNLLSIDNLRNIIGNSVSNFGTFPALGVVLTVMLGIGIAERSGWFEVMLQSSVTKSPTFLVIPTIAFIGILGNIAGDAAPIVLPPLAAMLFVKMGWHPLAGIALAYSAALGGFAANLMLGMSDALVQVFTQPAAELIDENIKTNVAMNWYFIAASVFMLIPVLWLVTKKITIPRLGAYDNPEMGSAVIDITEKQSKALRWANLSMLLLIVLLVVACIPEGSVFRNGETGSLIDDSPLMNGIGFLLAVFFLVPGLVYGAFAGTIKSSTDAAKMAVDSMASMANFIVIVFFAAQLLAFFGDSNLGALMAIKGAEALDGQPGWIVIIGIIVLSSIVNIFIGSASAKWAILAPIFVPMMMLLGFHPAFTQMLYRIGDGITNPITPMMPYFALVLSVAQRYDKNMKIGTFIATMLPYSIAIGLSWTVFILFWFAMGWPVGVDGPIHLPGN